MKTPPILVLRDPDHNGPTKNFTQKDTAYALTMLPPHDTNPLGLGVEGPDGTNERSGSMETGTYDIISSKLGKLQAAVERANRKAEKWGLTPLVLRIVATFVADTRVFFPDCPPDGIMIPTHRTTVEITGSPVRLAGHTFVGCVEHTSGGNILRAAPSFQDSDLSEYRHCAATCDHCRTVRNRNETYILRRDADGAFIRVGSSCLSDFLGGIDPHAIAVACEILRMRGGPGEEPEEAYGGGSPEVSLPWFLAYVAKAIRLFGWVPKSRADELDAPATVSQVYGLIRKAKPDRQDWRRAESCLRWAAAYFAFAKGNVGDYEHNLSAIVASGTLGSKGKSDGLAASLIPWIERKLSKVQAEQRPSMSQWLASEGTRFGGKGKGALPALTLVCDRVIECGGYYGVSYLHKFTDPNGNQVSWFSSNVTLEPGHTYRVTGTVKRHAEYKGTKETQLTRCKATRV